MFDVRCSPRSSRPALAVLVFICSLFTLSSAFGQGSLTPPGPPAATMLTLSQVEPRTPISSVPVTIARPGSYYLTTNLVCTVSNAILITVNSVTLDLNGFTLSSTVADAADGGTAILLASGLRNITVANGFIQGGVTNNGAGVYSGSGFSDGVYYLGSQPVNVMVSGISVFGCLYVGIYLGNSDSMVVDSSTVHTVGSYGIFASTINQSSAIDCGGDAIFGDQVSDCRGKSSGSGVGVYGSGAQNCYGTSISGTGVAGFAVENCYGESGGAGSGVYGINLQNSYGLSDTGEGANGTTVLNCYGSTSSGYGVYATIAQNCYGYSSGSGYGVYASYVASSSVGYSDTGTGVDAPIASVCHGFTSTGTALTTSHNINSY